MSTTYTTPETNLIKAADLARAREIDFAFQFQYGIKKLLEALGTTRKIAKVQGSYLKAYKATGTLEDGEVAEGELIPLSKYKTEPVLFDEITLKKWRKATTAEAIMEKGYDQAHDMTLARMMKDVQNGIKSDFFTFLGKGTGRASGATFQAAIAQAWGQLQVLFEDTDISAVYFLNPLDVADYLSTASVTIQNAFGMTYIEDFLGMGTVILNSNVEKGKVIATAKDNIVLYYLPVGGDIFGANLQFTTDETGYVGVHEGGKYDTMTDEDVVVSGITLFAERIDGIIIATIGEATPEVVLDKETATIPVAGTVALTATTVPAGQTVTWSSSDTSVATVSGGTVTGVAAGDATITASITVSGTSYTATCAVTVSAGA